MGLATTKQAKQFLLGFYARNTIYIWVTVTKKLQDLPLLVYIPAVLQPGT